jgi:hypothetical protein
MIARLSALRAPHANGSGAGARVVGAGAAVGALLERVKAILSPAPGPSPAPEPSVPSDEPTPPASEPDSALALVEPARPPAERALVRCDAKAVAVLDRRVSRLICSPITATAPDLDERLLHQWCALNRRVLFPRTPSLFAYEWHAEASPVHKFKGDLLLWDGASTFLAVECKATRAQGTQKARLDHVRQQAQLAGHMLPVFLQSRRRSGSGATIACASFLASHDAYRMSQPLRSVSFEDGGGKIDKDEDNDDDDDEQEADGAFPKLTFPPGVLTHLQLMPLPDVGSRFVTTNMQAHAALPNGLLAEQLTHAPPQLAKDLLSRCQLSLDSFHADARVIAPASVDTRLRRLLSSAEQAAAQAEAAAQTDAPRAAAAAVTAVAVSDAPQTAKGMPSAAEVEQMAVDALRSVPGYSLSISDLAQRVLPASTSFRELAIMAGNSAGGHPSRKLSFKQYLFEAGPFTICKKGSVTLKETCRSAASDSNPAAGTVV